MVIRPPGIVTDALDLMEGAYGTVPDDLEVANKYTFETVIGFSTFGNVACRHIVIPMSVTKIKAPCCMN